MRQERETIPINVDPIRLLRGAVECWPEFDRDEPVDACRLVDWFNVWRALAKQAIATHERSMG